MCLNIKVDRFTCSRCSYCELSGLNKKGVVQLFESLCPFVECFTKTHWWYRLISPLCLFEVHWTHQVGAAGTK